MTARMTNGRCMTARDASEAIAKVMKGSFSAARDGKAIITRNPASFRFVEDGRYRILFGSSRVPRDGEEVSGDSYTFKSGLPGQGNLCASRISGAFEALAGKISPLVGGVGYRYGIERLFRRRRADGISGSAGSAAGLDLPGRLCGIDHSVLRK